jgi:hypothetical protein
VGNPCANLVPLAVSAIDVGFVGALAALAAAVLTPLSNWLVTIATHKHERRLAHDERAFDARRDAFEEAVVQVHHSLAVARHYYARFADPTFPLADLDRGSVGETIELAGRIGVVGTPELISAIDDASNASFAFSRPQARFWNDSKRRRLARLRHRRNSRN